jgi:hypothetical protein
MATETAHEELAGRAGKNQSLFRAVNERVNDINEAHELWLALSDWVCECADETCADRIVMSPDEYERLRRNATHFAVAPGRQHVVPDVERVVEKYQRYWVVEKFGEAAAVAEKLDPRSPDSLPS